MQWIRHHNPDLAIFVDGVKTQTIDLSRYNYNALHTLFTEHFVRIGGHAGRGLAAGQTVAVQPLVPFW